MTAPGPNLDYIAAKAAAELAKELLGDDGTGGHVCKSKKTTTVEPVDGDNLVTKALGVIAESGVFACGLFLLSKSGGKVRWTDLKAEEVCACCTLAKLIEMAGASGWKGVQPEWTDTKLDAERLNERKRAAIGYLVTLSSLDLPRLLLIRQMWEQTLTYARYMMRSLKKKD